MLTREENELLTRVGAGTPMGTLMRGYWIPAVFSQQIAAPDSPPVRVRLLGEDLVAFRDSQMQPARMFAVPPETPAANVAVLRKAFTATMNDPAFTKEAVKRKTDIKWSTGEATQKMVEELYASDPKAVATVKAALAAKASKRKLTYATATLKSVELKRKGRRVYYMEDGRKFYVGISGKKTKLTIGGKKAKASKLKVGMSCKVNFAGPFSNAKSVACD